MAQGHTLYEILNVDPDLNKIQQNVFNETKIYLDTNVVIDLLFVDSNHVRGCDIFQAKFNRVHMNAFGQHVHMRFDRKSCLHTTKTAHGATDRCVGIDAIAGDTKMLDFIDHKNAHDRSSDNGWPIAAISAAIGNNFTGHSHERAVFFNA